MNILVNNIFSICRLLIMSNLQLELYHNKELEESQRFIDDMDAVMRDIEDLKEINETLFGHISSQNSELLNLENNTNNIVDHLDSVNLELTQAQEYQHSYNIKKGILLTTGVLMISFPVGVIIGVKAGIAAGIIGMGSGASAWYFNHGK